MTIINNSLVSCVCICSSRFLLKLIYYRKKKYPSYSARNACILWTEHECVLFRENLYMMYLLKYYYYYYNNVVLAGYRSIYDVQLVGLSEISIVYVGFV